MRRAAACAVLALLLAVPGHQTAAAGLCADAAALRAQGLAPLAAEYRQLQLLRGHFDGAAWQAPIDRHGARKHCVMDALRELLTRQRPAGARLQALLGEPDARWRRGEPALRLVPDEWHDRPFDELRWYRWRGTRDGLAVALVAGRVAAVAWSYAGE